MHPDSTCNTSSRKTLIVVGDRFLGFASLEHVMTLSQCLAACPQTYLKPSYDNITIGQGVSAPEHKIFLQHLSAHHINISVSLPKHFNHKESSNNVHKHNPDNILISHPKPTGNNVFESALLINNNCELMLDHTTGMHIQGMVLIEASRQLMLSIVENYILSKHPDTKHRFTLLNIHSNFERFAFPVEVLVTCHLDIQSLPETNVLAQITCTFTQFEEKVSTVKIKFSACKERVVLRQEVSTAKKLLQTL